jgi:glyoxylase-like metal-dependent hydrolase (beta-lactamase superfamily II)
VTVIHHLNCATMCPAAGRFPRFVPGLVAHCLLVERDDGLLLVDTGLGTGDLGDPKRLGAGFTKMVGAALDPAEPAVAQVRALGFQPADVRDIVVTHLDCDHAGGLGDFPWAHVHVHADELAAARARPTQKEKGRYRPAQWAHRPSWVEHDGGGEDWLGFGAVRTVGDDVLMVPLPGHTRGHSAVAVRRPDGGWLLHAGDAYFYAGEKERPPSCPPGLRLFQSVVQMDKTARHANAERLRELHARHGGLTGDDHVTMFCAHDAAELAALQSGVTGSTSA